jgi:hypothetical protein
MLIKRIVRACVVVLLVSVLFVIWWSIASNYDYGALAGTYRLHTRGVSCTLILKADGSFQQGLVTHGARLDSTGSWRRVAMSGVDFSSGFLRFPGAKTSLEEFPDSSPADPDANTFHGHFEKVLGIYTKLNINANPPGPTFYKSLFPSNY